MLRNPYDNNEPSTAPALVATRRWSVIVVIHRHSLSRGKGGGTREPRVSYETSSLFRVGYSFYETDLRYTARAPPRAPARSRHKVPTPGGRLVNRRSRMNSIRRRRGGGAQDSMVVSSSIASSSEKRMLVSSRLVRSRRDARGQVLVVLLLLVIRLVAVAKKRLGLFSAVGRRLDGHGDDGGIVASADRPRGAVSVDRDWLDGDRLTIGRRRRPRRLSPPSPPSRNLVRAWRRGHVRRPCRRCRRACRLLSSPSPDDHRGAHRDAKSTMPKAPRTCRAMRSILKDGVVGVDEAPRSVPPFAGRGRSRSPAAEVGHGSLFGAGPRVRLKPNNCAPLGPRCGPRQGGRGSESSRPRRPAAPSSAAAAACHLLRSTSLPVDVSSPEARRRFLLPRSSSPPLAAAGGGTDAATARGTTRGLSASTTRARRASRRAEVERRRGFPAASGEVESGLLPRAPAAVTR